MKNEQLIDEARELCRRLARFDLIPLDRRYLVKWLELIARNATLNDKQMTWLRACVDSYAQPKPTVTASRKRAPAAEKIKNYVGIG